MKTYEFVGGVAVATALILATGCGEDDPKTAPTNKGGAAGSSSTAGSKTDGGGGVTGGSSAGSTASGPAGAGGVGEPDGVGGAGGDQALTFQSMPAGIELELAPTSAEGLTITSTSITQETTTDLFYTEWFGELHNGTDQIQCLIRVSGDFQDAAGLTVIAFDSFSQGAAYKLGTSKLSSPCVAPGESVPLWSNDLPMKALALASIKKLVVEIEPLTSPDAVLHPSTPTLGPLTKTYSANFKAWQISGSATATADIYNATINFWGKSGAFFIGKATEYHLEDLLKNQTWAMDTAPLGIESVTLTEVVPHFSFIDGLKGAALRVVYDKETSALMAVYDAAQLNWDASRDRQVQFRASSKQ